MARPLEGGNSGGPVKTGHRRAAEAPPEAGSSSEKIVPGGEKGKGYRGAALRAARPRTLLHQFGRGQDPTFAPPGQSFGHFAHFHEMSINLLVVGGGYYFGNL
jgi:hypothetical protein